MIAMTTSKSDTTIRSAMVDLVGVGMIGFSLGAIPLALASIIPKMLQNLIL